MNTTNANTTPTPTAPAQVPEVCPACNSKVKWNKESQVHFECGCTLSFYPTQGWVYHVYTDAGWACHRAYESAIALRAERDAALAQVKMLSDNEGGALTFHILRTWDREKLERFCLHLLGDDWQTLTARVAELQAVVENRESGK